MQIVFDFGIDRQPLSGGVAVTAKLRWMGYVPTDDNKKLTFHKQVRAIGQPLKPQDPDQSTPGMVLITDREDKDKLRVKLHALVDELLDNGPFPISEALNMTNVQPRTKIFYIPLLRGRPNLAAIVDEDV